ncbi:uncharacterized protein LOC128511930 [Clarias gariepinus]|uniref:uncharacterized protein LOC128511930 n=1 Tax=Clarias gariepinus TaxID=13013 RepID=UPI00234DE1AE|nr:uncharacterized protein LOC128511930 [Clarias gariepinus]
MTKLNIHLVPGNVPVEEVQKRQECNTYIMTSSKCILTPGEIYRPCCKTTECDCISQPEHETFDCDFGPNFHPTYEVILSEEVKKVTLSLLDEKGEEVWMPRVVFLTGTKRTSLTLDSTGADFVDKHSEKLIQRVSAVMEIADHLKARDFITNEMYSNIQVKATPQEKMRTLYTCLDSGGTSVKTEFYKILREKERFLVDDLESGFQ